MRPLDDVQAALVRDPREKFHKVLPASSHVQIPSHGGCGRTARLAGRAARARRRDGCDQERMKVSYLSALRAPLVRPA